MQVKTIYDCLTNNGVEYYFGVPDSLLKDFSAYVYENHDEDKTVITANEGNAIAMACGSYLSSKKPAVVYIQNSGLGNCVNPLLSLADEEVYRIPLLFIVGWRGEPGKKDEPQHIKQGKVTIPMLETMNMEYKILPQDEKEALDTINYACKYMKEESKPFTILVQNGTFDKYSAKPMIQKKYDFNREDAIKIIVDNISEKDAIVSTTGKASRELFEYRETLGQSHNKDFLTVGSMGHSSTIAAGIALDNPNKQIICLDGDGSFIMHMGSLVVNKSMKLKNFKHIILNNHAHESVGGQPTCSDNIDFVNLAKSCGYNNVFSISSKNELKNIINEFLEIKDSAILEIKINIGSRKDLGRPTTSPIENKENFMRFLNDK